MKIKSIKLLRVLLSITLSFFMFMNFIVISHAQSVPVSISIDNVASNRGETIQVPVRLANLESGSTISAFNFSIAYDNTRLEAIDVIPGSIIPANSDFDYAINGNVISFLFEDNASGENPISNNGELAVIKFKVKDNAEVGRAFVQRFVDANETFADKDLKKLSVNLASGSVWVDDGSAPYIISAWLDTDADGVRINADIDNTNKLITLIVPKGIRTLTSGRVNLSENIKSATFTSENPLPTKDGRVLYSQSLTNLTSDSLTTKLLSYFGNNTSKQTLLNLNGSTLQLTDYSDNTIIYTFVIIEESEKPIKVSVSKHIAPEETTVDLTISLSDLPMAGISAADFRLLYDNTKFRVVSIERGNIIKSNEDFDYQINNGQISFLFSDESNEQLRSIKESGVFARVKLEVLNTDKVGMFNMNISNVGSFVSPSLIKYSYALDQGYVDVYKYGDVNGDGRVASDDYGMVKSYILGRISNYSFRHGLLAADVNIDNEITSLDYLAIKKFLLGKIAKFPIQ